MFLNKLVQRKRAIIGEDTMNLKENEIGELLHNAFSLDFIQITLTQMGTETPTIFSGPGTICQKNDGKLYLKLYHAFVNVERELYGDTGKLVSGKIIGDEHYFSLKAKDMKGHEWVAESLLPSGEISLPAEGRVIESEIRELRNVENRYAYEDLNKSYLFMLVKGDYEIPPNEREELPNGGSWWNTFNIHSESYHLRMRSKAGYLTIEMDGNSEHLKPKLSDTLLEGLNVVFGKILAPIYRELVHEETRTITLSSVPIEIYSLKIQEPIPHTAPHHFEAVKEFIENYLKVFSEPWGNFYGFWHKIIHASQGSTENVALVLTVAIEGIIKHYFKEYGYPDEEFKKEMDIALAKIKGLDIADRIKNRIASSLGRAKTSIPKNALFKLAAEGWYEKELVDSWVGLRNKSTHADKLDTEHFQKFIDSVNKSLFLFYILLFIKIDYENTYFDFASEGWPQKSFGRTSIQA